MQWNLVQSVCKLGPLQCPPACTDINYNHHSYANWPILLTLILLTWTIWRAPTNASKWRMGFNSVFKGLISDNHHVY